MITKRPFKYVFSETEIDDFLQHPEEFFYFEDFVTRMIDINAKLIKLSALRRLKVVITKYTKDEKVIHTEIFHLPVSEETNFEALLDSFNQEKPPKRKKASSEKEKRRFVVQPPYTERRMTVKLAMFLKIMCLFFLLLGTFYLGKSVQSEPKIPSEVSEQLNNLEKQVQQQPQIDTFSRYFLTNYYTGITEGEKVQERINRFVDKGLLKDVSGTDKQVKSILPWEAKRKGSTWHLAYIVTLQDPQEQTTTQQVSFSIKEQDQQYKVMTIPKEEPFEINH
ncbi:hypothetical protein AB1I62_09215 [Enterococcus sp. AN402]|uniref:hypothetical protein n=1 Tax=Enterococcus sp. AN402 TaxID=3151386 RepID=UPI00345B05B4